MKTRGRNRVRRKVRPLSAFRDLRSEIGHAAESGGTVHIALGGGSLTGGDAVTSLAALELVEGLAETAVLYNAPPIITVGDPTLLPLTEDVLRRAYERHGLLEQYDPSRVRYLAPSPIAYAAGAADTIMTEDVTSNVTAGAFGAEVSLITDAATRRGLPQSAAAAALDAIGAQYPATSRLAPGEDLFAAGAELTGERRYFVSLVAQDWLRLGLVAVILGLVLVRILGMW